MRIRRVVEVAVIVMAAWQASAGTINYAGTFTTDDQKATFVYSVQNQGPVSISTTSFELGGFFPILSVFDPGGALVFLSDGYANPNGEAALSWVSDAGAAYTVILTEYDNFPTGNLTDAFQEDGQGNFTTTLSGFPGPFRAPDGTQLTGDWAVTFASADPTLVVTPEPATGMLALGGILLAGWQARRRTSRAPGLR